MTDLYPRAEIKGQTSLLDLEPRPRPHQGARLAVLQAIEAAAGPVTAHELSPIVRSPANCVAKRLGELETDRHVHRVRQVPGPYGRDVWQWQAAH